MEDRLSPDLGRLIDEAKVAARALGREAAEVEGVAVLVENGEIYSGASNDRNGEETGAEAAEQALRRAEAAGPAEVLAAAVAAPFDTAETVSPSVGTHGRLSEIDPELPLIFKKHGRWVILPASEISPQS